jgi:ADP-heptose:LPS heptosyltransferase
LLYVLLALLLLPFVCRRAGGETRTILVVQTGKIGDFVCTTPLFHALRVAFPKAKIVVALHPVNAGLAAQLPFFDQLLDIPSGSLSGWQQKMQWVRRIKALQPDLAICCTGGLAWPFILAMSGIPRRLGVSPNFMGRSTRFAQRLWTDSVLHDGSQLIGSTYARLLAVLGIDQVGPAKVLRASPGGAPHVNAFLADAGHPDGQRLAGLAISAANKLKELGQPLLEGVCRRLLAAEPALSIVLLGGPGDKPLAAALIDALGSPWVIDSCGIFALDEVPALLQRLDVFVGVDSGLTYMADTFDIPLVSLAGPCNMLETRPVNAKAVILQEKLPCVPCAHIFKAPYSCHLGTRACIVNVQAETIANAALALLAQAGHETS